MSMDTYKGHNRGAEFMVHRRSQRQRIPVTRTSTHHRRGRRHLEHWFERERLSDGLGYGEGEEGGRAPEEGRVLVVEIVWS